MIHSKGAYMQKKSKAMAHAQEYDKSELKLDGLVLVCYVSVEDQDTFDTDIISKQGADEILAGIDLIQGFPGRVQEENEEVAKGNEKLRRQAEAAAKNPKVKPPTEKPREPRKLILDPSMYKVDRVLVYPWAHLSNFLSNESTASEVCPKIAALLKQQGIDAHYSPFGWYKAFKIECLGHEVAESFRDVRLAVLADEVRATSQFKIITEKGKIMDFCDNSEESRKKAKIPEQYSGPDWKDFQDFIRSEVLGLRAEEGEPPHIALMKKFEIADFDDASDQGNFRWYTRGIILKSLIRDYVEHLVIENGAVLVDTPVMYTVKNKKLTAQTARFPAKTYTVLSGNNRYLLRFASDFLLFNMFSEMNIREETMPLRAYEYEQYAFRREQAGELSGLRRLRAFTMPDMHTLCKDLPQAVEEFKRQFVMDNKCLRDLGIKTFMIVRTTEEFWAENKAWIVDVVKSEARPAMLELWPERYYYFIMKYERPALSVAGQSSCLATIQIDVESAEDYIEQYGKKRQKYNISWHGKDGSSGHPIILHNSPSGGMERVVWALLEGNIRTQETHVTGFKTWLSPIQARVMSVGKDQASYAQEVADELNRRCIRADLDDRDETVGKKIRQAEVEWIPYTVVVGAEEVKNKTVSIRKRLIGEKIIEGKTSEQINNVSLDDLVAMVDKDLEGFPRRELPLPFRKFSTRVYFRT
ncbi:MAG: threonine--tRNA ligase [Candidatus Lokiarchaeota archaeon]|nr:threonine--tRNA ligase [Candidatus Lokiarchaeota archaeon]